VSRDEGGFFMPPVAEGGAARLVARLLPDSRVVGALQQFSAEHVVLASLGTLETDVPVVSDDIEAADLIEGRRRGCPAFWKWSRHGSMQSELAKCRRSRLAFVRLGLR
jgi:hypothetical protein